MKADRVPPKRETEFFLTVVGAVYASENHERYRVLESLLLRQ